MDNQLALSGFIDITMESKSTISPVTRIKLKHNQFFYLRASGSFRGRSVQCCCFHQHNNHNLRFTCNLFFFQITLHPKGCGSKWSFARMLRVPSSSSLVLLLLNMSLPAFFASDFRPCQLALSLSQSPSFPTSSLPLQGSIPIPNQANGLRRRWKAVCVSARLNELVEHEYCQLRSIWSLDERVVVGQGMRVLVHGDPFPSGGGGQFSIDQGSHEQHPRIDIHPGACRKPTRSKWISSRIGDSSRDDRESKVPSLERGGENPLRSETHSHARMNTLRVCFSAR